MSIRTKDEIKVRLYDILLEFDEINKEGKRLTEEQSELKKQLNDRTEV